MVCIAHHTQKSYYFDVGGGGGGGGGRRLLGGGGLTFAPFVPRPPDGGGGLDDFFDIRYSHVLTINSTIFTALEGIKIFSTPVSRCSWPSSVSHDACWSEK